MTKVVIAVDSRPLIGAGHVSRVIAISEELLNRHYSVHWFVSDLNNCRKLMDFFQADANFLKKIEINQANLLNVDLLVIDSYDELFIQKAIQIYKPNLTVQIVDETSPTSIFASVRWSGSILSEKASKRLGERCVLYSGLEFVPIRNKVRALRSSIIPIPRNKKDSIIVALGASDIALQIIDKLLESISDLRFSGDVFVSHPKYQMNSDFSNFRYLDPREMLNAALHRDSLVICGGGITSLELLFLRLDFLVLKVANNQAAQIEYLCKNKYSEEIELEDPNQVQETLLRGLTNLTPNNKANLESLGQGSFLFADWIDRFCHFGVVN